MKYRMTWFRELRWLIASYLIGWALELVAPEATPALLDGFKKIAGNFFNDPRYDTVPVRRTFT